MLLFYLLTAIICLGYVVLLASYIHGWKKTPAWLLKQQTTNSALRTKVSIIIPARNEEGNIQNILSSIYRQTYPLEYFEVIVVNDHSSDKTSEIVASQKYENLKLVHLLQSQTGKKRAISVGVKNASGDLIITTDADCEMGENWLSSIVSFYEERKPKMIIAPVVVKEESGLQEIMQSQEMSVLSACACGSAYFNAPILCSGANLAYEKSAFVEVNGFDGVDKTATGDDIFLMLKMTTKFPEHISYLKSRDAIIYTNPARTSPEALRQRKRWASKTFSLGFSHVTGVAILIFFTNFLILFSGIMSVINLKFVLVPVSCLVAKSLVDFMLLNASSSFFGKNTHPFVFAIASLFYPFYVTLIGLVSPLTNYSWKGRES